MSKSYDFQGKNVDEALHKASTALHIPVEKIKHEVIAYGSSGIFGLVGVKKAKIKVFVEKANRKKDALSTDTQKKVESPSSSQSASEKEVSFDDDIVSFGVQALQKIVDGITSDADVHVTQQGEKLCFSITGGESGVLIGKRGQTLESIQYLLEKMINKKNSSRVRVVVDVEGYLEKRRENLQQMATRMAEKAKRIKKPVTIGQMNAHDRRIIHIHLKDDTGVRTQSIGDGYIRKLMIFPKKGSGTKRKK
jgi:spoIIIJ-associated protein